MRIRMLGLTQRRVIWGIICTSLLAAMNVLPTHAYANSETLENRVRAAFLFNFARYTTWPATATKPSDFRFCIVESASISKALEDTLEGKQVLGLRPSISLLEHADQVRECRLLYLPQQPDSQLQAWLKASRDHAVLVISEGRSFPQSYPGMVGFYLLDGRIRFSINPTYVKQAGMQMSSRLLSLADIISGER